MRYAVLSDIHANLEALTVVLDWVNAHSISRILCLGDIIGYGAEPAACLERLQSCDAYMVCGNHEAGCVGRLPQEWFHEAARAALSWTSDQLSFSDLDAIRRLPMTKVVDGLFTLAHATPKDPERFAYVADVAQAVEALTVCRTSFCLIGHTHVPWFVEYDVSLHRMGRVLAAPDALKNILWDNSAGGMRYLVNPGSVGQPRDGDPRASFAVIDTDKKTLSIERLSYDIDAAGRKIRAAGLPELLAARLSFGR